MIGSFKKFVETYAINIEGEWEDWLAKEKVQKVPDYKKIKNLEKSWKRFLRNSEDPLPKDSVLQKFQR
jgi:hypothetical protein